MITDNGDGGGVSRGFLKEGGCHADRGGDILSFIPLHLSAIDWSPSLVAWLKTTWVGRAKTNLNKYYPQPQDHWYYERRHDIVFGGG
jgi:hypothetical protein